MKKSVLFLPLVFVLAGCFSSPLPPALTPEEQAFIKGSETLVATAAVKEYKHPVYSEELYKTLKTANVFSDVIYLGDVHDKKVAYVVEVNRRIHGKASLWPLLSVISVGVIPTWVEERHGISFILRKMDDPSDVRYVEVVWSGTTILGWAGFFTAILPGRTWDPEASARYYDRVRLATFKALSKPGKTGESK